MFDTESSMDTAMAAFAQLDGEPKDQTEVQQPEAADEPEDTDTDTSDPDVNDELEADASDEADEPEDEPVDPVVDPPAHWNADNKKLFASLPPSAQQAIAAEIGKQETVIGKAQRDAATSRKETQALTEGVTNLHRQYAEQLDQYAQAFQPQKPDYSLLATDPQQYAYQMQVHDAVVAQRDEIARQAAHAKQQVHAIEQQQEAKARQTEYAAIVEAFPEWDTPAGRKAIADELTPIGKALGYDDDLMAQAGATDLKALRMAAGWKSKADKYDAAIARNMQKVREAKVAKVATPGTAQPRGSARAQQVSDSMKRLKQTGDVRDAAALFAKLG